MRVPNYIGFVGVSLLALSAPAFAQGAPATEGFASDDIIVTARRKEETAQDVPLTVNAIPQDTLSKLQVRDFKDVATLVPGLSLTPSADGIQPSTTLRGVNYDVTASGLHGTVAYYVNDGLAVATTVFASMYDIAQIEVLRGPQGTLRGESVPSGSITIITHKPDLDEIGGYVNGTATDIGGLNANGAVNVPIIKGVLAVRVAGLVNHDEANRIRSINDPSFRPYRNQWSERASVRFDPTDNIDIIATYDHGLLKSRFFDQVESSLTVLNQADPVHVPFDHTPGSTLLTPGDRAGVEYHPWNNSLSFNQYNVQAQWKFSGQKLNYVFGRTDQHVFNIGEGDIGAAFLNYPGLTGDFRFTPGYTGDGTSGSNTNLFNYGNITQSDTVSLYHELRLSNEERVAGIFDYVVGGMINRQKTTNLLQVAMPLFLDPALGFAPSLANPPIMGQFHNITMIPLPPGQGRDLENSLFANLTAHIGEATEISAGLRYIIWNHSDDAGVNTKFTPVIYNVSLKHRFNDNIMVYASTGSSWRIPQGTNPIILQFSGQILPPTDPALAGLAGVVPETSKSYEIGFKTDWLDKRLRFNVTAYHQVFKNYTLSAPGHLPLCANNNVANPSACTLASTASLLSVGVPAKVDGVEAELFYQPSRNFSFAANVSYSLSKVQNGLVPCNNPADTLTPSHQISFCSTNQRAGVSAPFSATIQSEYSHPIADGFNGFLRGLASYYGNSLNDPTNPYDDVKSYAIVNLFAGVRASNGAWEVTGYVKNLLNTERVLSRDAIPEFAVANTFTANPIPVISNYRAITMTPEREFGVNLRYAFGSR